MNKKFSIVIPFWPIYLTVATYGVYHYTHHKCIALAAAASLLMLKGRK